MLRLRSIHTYYGNVHVLKGISLHVREGELVALIGANGAGKTTTLKTISGLLKPGKGKIELATAIDIETDQYPGLLVQKYIFDDYQV